MSKYDRYVISRLDYESYRSEVGLAEPVLGQGVDYENPEARPISRLLLAMSAFGRFC